MRRPLSVMCAISQEPPASKVRSTHLRLRLGNYRSLIICRCALRSIFGARTHQLAFHLCHLCTIFRLCSVYVFMGHIFSNFKLEFIFKWPLKKRTERLAGPFSQHFPHFHFLTPRDRKQTRILWWEKWESSVCMLSRWQEKGS